MTKRNEVKNLLLSAKDQKEAVQQLRKSIKNNESMPKRIEKMNTAFKPLIQALSSK